MAGPAGGSRGAARPFQEREVPRAPPWHERATDLQAASFSLARAASRRPLSFLRADRLAWAANGAPDGCTKAAPLSTGASHGGLRNLNGSPLAPGANARDSGDLHVNAELLVGLGLVDL